MWHAAQGTYLRVPVSFEYEGTNGFTVGGEVVFVRRVGIAVVVRLVEVFFAVEVTFNLTPVVVLISSSSSSPNMMLSTSRPDRLRDLVDKGKHIGLDPPIPVLYLNLPTET